MRKVYEIQISLLISKVWDVAALAREVRLWVRACSGCRAEWSRQRPETLLGPCGAPRGRFATPS